ncbi:helix-turn-helix domain-containing protein [Leucobacter albus]|uniref:Helix-turn-helix domain-containing protein n=1 Tax=Leucobacter albus TaxID=272210 RepID=A0ABW3TNI6_9MICO
MKFDVGPISSAFVAAWLEYLHKVVEMSYTLDMSNVTQIATKQPAGNAHVGGIRLWNMLENERWTFRKLEARTGIKVGVISSRMRGVTPLTIEEVQVFASVLGRNPVELYAELVNDETPTPSASETTSNHRTLVP